MLLVPFWHSVLVVTDNAREQRCLDLLGSCVHWFALGVLVTPCLFDSYCLTPADMTCAYLMIECFLVLQLPKQMLRISCFSMARLGLFVHRLQHGLCLSPANYTNRFSLKSQRYIASLSIAISQAIDTLIHRHPNLYGHNPAAHSSGVQEKKDWSGQPLMIENNRFSVTLISALSRWWQKSWGTYDLSWVVTWVVTWVVNTSSCRMNS